MKLRIKELAEALNTDVSDVLSICAILSIKASSAITSLSLEDCKKITDFYEENK
tara:strand:+ start:9217 stop:9378 length:162 start_codon:yes stop_codon:yes gene_type:complete